MKEKYNAITIKILIGVLGVISIFFLDRWVLPQERIQDEIYGYRKIFKYSKNKFSSGSRSVIGYIYYTQKGFEFSTEKRITKEAEKITVQRSLFGNLTSLRSDDNDYSDKVLSGFNGSCLYITIGLAISILISLLILLQFNTGLSENGFQNIILLNIMLALYALYVAYLYN